MLAFFPLQRPGSGRQGWRAMWAGEGGPEMTSSVSHSASAPAAESQGGGYGTASCSRQGANPEMALVHCQGVAHPSRAQARRSGCRRRFPDLGDRRAAGFKGGSAVYP